MYRHAWDLGNGPGQAEQMVERIARRARVLAAREKTNRLITWLRFFRQPQDIGVGDTANRLRMLASKPSEIHNLIKRLMDQCDCQPVDAIARLNADHKYE